MKIKNLVILILILIVMNSTVFGVVINPTADAPGTTEILSIGGIFLGVIQVVAVAVGIVVLAVLGIKYMSAAPAEKAGIKNSMVIYIVGAILLFAGSAVISIVQGIGDTINEGSGSLIQPSTQKPVTQEQPATAAEIAALKKKHEEEMNKLLDEQSEKLLQLGTHLETIYVGADDSKTQKEYLEEKNLNNGGTDYLPENNDVAVGNIKKTAINNQSEEYTLAVNQLQKQQEAEMNALLQRGK